MKRSGKEPRLLAQVMQAIADLREGSGSTQKKILDQVTQCLKKSNAKTRNLTIQVRRALKHGVDTGLIKQRSGKFRLGLDPKDYAVFKSFRSLDPLNDCMHGRRGKRRRKGRRRRRGRRGRRRRSIGRSPDDDATDSAGSESDYRKSRSITGTPEPQDRGRRGRRRGRKRRRRRRRGRRHASAKSSDTEGTPTKGSSKEIVPQRKRSDENRRDEHPDRRSDDHSHNNAKDEIECGNPDCLCNIKQEMNDVHRTYSRNNHFDENYDSYIN